MIIIVLVVFDSSSFEYTNAVCSNFVTNLPVVCILFLFVPPSLPPVARSEVAGKARQVAVYLLL
jgi:hypothetical protein